MGGRDIEVLHGFVTDVASMVVLLAVVCGRVRDAQRSEQVPVLFQDLIDARDELIHIFR